MPTLWKQIHCQRVIQHAEPWGEKYSAVRVMACGPQLHRTITRICWKTFNYSSQNTHISRCHPQVILSIVHINKQRTTVSLFALYCIKYLYTYVQVCLIQFLQTWITQVVENLYHGIQRPISFTWPIANLYPAWQGLTKNIYKELYYLFPLH